MATFILLFSVLLDMSHSIFSYLVSRKMKVYKNAWLLKKKACAFWEMDPESHKILGRKRHVQDSSPKKFFFYSSQKLQSSLKFLKVLPP